ncbi:glycosyltransferase 87 family protein [Nonomuraea typhae]|uniref:glycosyltransferase 87 family protein n=1 Tax=Nonomuraea typhae TaxID=2603600 RepID=UPI0012FC6388|nr:glycosyltransferase 87 family protein [Nonomuraea typhae]
MTGGKRQWQAWLLAAAIVALAAWPLVEFWLTNPDDQRLVDLDVYRSGGQVLREGRPLYDYFTPAPQLLPFTYPPIAGLLAMPLAVMSWTTAQWVWTIGVFAALAVAVWFSFRQAAVDRKPLLFALAMVCCTYLMPIRDQVRFGQVDILLVALCVADILAVKPRWPRGFLIGLATAVKLTPGVFLIYLLVTRQWRTFWMAVTVTAALTLLPFAVIPQDAFAFWFEALLDPNRLGANAATTNQSVRGMLIRLYLPDLLTSALWLAIVAAIGWYGFRGAYRAYQAKDHVTAVALVGLMAVLLSPVAWIHHLAWVVVVLGAVVGDARDRVRLWVAAGVWLYYVVPIPWWGVSLKALEIPVISPVLGKIVQNGYGLGAIVLVWLLASWLPKRRTTLTN